VERCRVYYKGEGGGFPQVRVVVSLVCPCCSWLVLAPKVFQLRTNHLVWVLCRPVWVSEACQLFLVPSWSSSTPLYPSKCCELRSMPRLLFLPLFSTWTHIWVFQGVGSASTLPQKLVVSHLDATSTIDGLWWRGQILVLKIRISHSHNFISFCYLSFFVLCWVCHLHLIVFHSSSPLAIMHGILQDFTRYCWRCTTFRWRANN
jgi:hypothetical protein